MLSNKVRDTVSYGPGSVFDDSHFSHLEGRLLTILESIGLPEGQEKAVKDLVRSELWITFGHGSYITGNQRTAIIKENSSVSMNGTAQVNSLPN